MTTTLLELFKSLGDLKEDQAEALKDPNCKELVISLNAAISKTEDKISDLLFND